MRGAFAVLLVLGGHAASAAPVTLWHAYRGAEEQALTEATKAFTRTTGIDVELLAVPYDAFSGKLSNAIPHGNGPDVFLFNHERLRLFREEGLIAPSDGILDAKAYVRQSVDALTVDGHSYGYPLSLKCLALYLNENLLPPGPNGPQAPRTSDEWLSLMKAQSRPGQNRFGLAFESGNFYYLVPFLFGFGGELFDASGRSQFDTPAMAKALGFVKRLQDEQYLPSETSGALVKSLFNENQAAMVIDGPWFAGEIVPSVPYAIVRLPTVSETGIPMRPFLGVEAAYVSARSSRLAEAQQLARFLSVGEAALIRARVGKQIPAELAAYEQPDVKGDKLLSAFRDAALDAVPMPNTVEMARVWEPMKLAMRSTLHGQVSPEQAGALADWRYRALYRPRPAPASPLPYAIGLAVLALAGAVYAWQTFKRSDAPWARRYPELRRGVAYVAPAAVGVLVLVIVPLAFGAALSLFHHEPGHYDFVGLGNFKDILASPGYRITEPLSFYFTLAVTLVWSVVNVVLHVSIGLFLALLLKNPLLKLRGVYRVLLIVPWAVPNYITALMWKNMFHRQFGAINALLSMLGIQPVEWFTHFSTAFAANVATNTWLGFPFMMVVALGALQAIPQDLYEAAEVDGASSWAQFRRITLPLLRPAMLPAVILGGIWTFNMFIIPFRVSGGEPGGATDILVTDAYRWAFERNEQYGFAAAYSVLIFFVLVGYSFVTKRMAKNAEELMA